MANYNGINEELYMMLCCFKETAENIVREYEAITQRCGEIVDAIKEAKDNVDDLLDKNRIPEFQKAFRHAFESTEESKSVHNYSLKLKVQMIKSQNSMIRLGRSYNRND